MKKKRYNRPTNHQRVRAVPRCMSKKSREFRLEAKKVPSLPSDEGMIKKATLLVQLSRLGLALWQFVSGSDYLL